MDIKVINIRDDKFYGGRGDKDREQSIKQSIEQSTESDKESDEEYNSDTRDSDFNDDKFFSEGGSSYDDEFLNEPNSKVSTVSTVSTVSDNDLDLFADDASDAASDVASDAPNGGGKKDDIIEELSGDPMFMVLTHMLISKKGNSIADLLEEIKDHLAFIRMKLT